MTERAAVKLFMNGRSQAVRIPKDLSFDCAEVFIRKDPDTGDVILSKKPGTWGDFFEFIESANIPKDFMADRDNEPTEERDLF